MDAYHTVQAILEIQATEIVNKSNTEAGTNVNTDINNWLNIFKDLQKESKFIDIDHLNVEKGIKEFVVLREKVTSLIRNVYIRQQMIILALSLQSDIITTTETITPPLNYMELDSILSTLTTNLTVENKQGISEIDEIHKQLYLQNDILTNLISKKGKLKVTTFYINKYHCLHQFLNKPDLDRQKKLLFTHINKEKVLLELSQYFISRNDVPVSQATIKAEDFWRITGLDPEKVKEYHKSHLELGE